MSALVGLITYPVVLGEVAPARDGERRGEAVMDPIFIVAGLLGVATDTDAIARDLGLRLHAESIERRAEREQTRRWRRGRVLAQREHVERVKERNDDAAIIARARLLGWDPKRDASAAVVLQPLPERTRQRKPRKRERWVPTALRGVE